MHAWLFGEWRTVGYVAASAVLIYLSVVLALRFGERRTLAEMTAYDFAVAVALGAIIGRTATTQSPTYVQGITATVTLLVTHNVLSWARARWRSVQRAIDHGPLVLVRHGRPDRLALDRAHVTDEDLAAVLREHGYSSLHARLDVVLESRGAFSVVDHERNGANARQ